MSKKHILCGTGRSQNKPLQRSLATGPPLLHNRSKICISSSLSGFYNDLQFGRTRPRRRSLSPLSGHDRIEVSQPRPLLLPPVSKLRFCPMPYTHTFLQQFFSPNKSCPVK